MTNNDQFNDYLDLCEEIAERLYREGVWPWRDSTNQSDLVDSDHNSNDL